MRAAFLLVVLVRSLARVGSTTLHVGRRYDDRDDRFDNLDINRNGTLTPDEWKWTTRSFNRYDTNSDGALTRREFTAGGGTPAAAR